MMGIAFLVTCLSYSYFCTLCLMYCLLSASTTTAWFLSDAMTIQYRVPDVESFLGFGSSRIVCTALQCCLTVLGCTLCNFCV